MGSELSLYIAVTVLLLVMLTVHVLAEVLDESHPNQEEKLPLPLVAGAVKMMVVLMGIFVLL